MRVERFEMENFRSFVATPQVALDSINVFIGPNNTGKSSVLRALSVIQQPNQFQADIRLGATSCKIRIGFRDVQTFRPWRDLQIESATLDASISPQEEPELQLLAADGRRVVVSALPATEPNHFVVPYLSKRKTSGYVEDVSEQRAMAVAPDFTYLAAKLSRLGNPGFPGHRRYFDTCNEILGFTVTAVPSTNGQRPGTFLESGQTLPLDQMGEGVPNIVGLLADLALAKGKLFLVEEPENDLHPEALKALLDLLIQSAQNNQIVVSTHSNIVAKHLGSAENSLLYHVDAERGAMPPQAKIELVPPNPSARIQVLRELGYSFSDFDLWDGWIMLEESSAERIIRDYLVPWFAPRLSRVRTLATKGNAEIEPTFADFNRLVRFTHLEDAYRNSAWVLVDGDADGRKIVERLRETYSGWEPDRFECFDRERFEDYYPGAFRQKVVAALEVADKQERRRAKSNLLAEVRAWLDQDEDRGRVALAKSAAAVIEQLRRIEAQLPVP